MKRIANLALCLVLMTVSVKVSAQSYTPTLPELQASLDSINKVFDSAVYLAVDIEYLYNTNVVAGKSSRSKLDGEYAFNEHRFYYRVGPNEYLRNDSFSAAVYNEQKYIVLFVNKDKRASSASLPVKAMLDTAFYATYGHYTRLKEKVPGPNEDSVWKISLTRVEGDSSVQYDYISVSYNVHGSAITSIEYGFPQPIYLDENDTTETPSGNWNAHFTVNFKNYRSSSLQKLLFSESRFAHEEHPGVWVPAEKYKGYELFFSETDDKILLNR